MGNIPRDRRNFKKIRKNFRKFAKIMLDKWEKGWYHNRARVGEICEFFRKRKRALR